MKEQILYKELAKYYDMVYHWKDYKRESVIIKNLIRKFRKSKGNKLLEAGCGTGKHLKYLKNNFDCMGIDSNEEMLEIARKNARGVPLIKGNMVNFRISRNFDVILCLFSSIGYVKTYRNLEKAITNFSNHLKVGGIAIIEPWFTKSNFKAGNPHMSIYDSKNIKIARLNISEVKGDLSIMDMHYLIAEKDRKVRHFVDRHELGLFGVKDTLRIMREAGLKSVYLKNGLMKDRGLYIGVKE